MPIPSLSDFKFYIGELINNTYWDYNWTKVKNMLSDSTFDLQFKSFNVNSDSSMGNAKITNLAIPTLSTDAANKEYVDSASTPRNYISGLEMSNNVAAPNTDIDFSVGIAQNSSNSGIIQSNSAMTKRASAAWAAGNGNGMLDTGTFANSTWYHCFIISKADGTSDFLCSTSVSTPVLPTGYINKRRIGSIQTNSSGNIKAFYQRGNRFFRKPSEYLADIIISSGAMPTSKTNYTLPTPLGIQTDAIIFFEYLGTASTTYGISSNPNDADVAPSSTVFNIFNSSPGGVADIIAWDRTQTTDTSSRISLRFSSASGSLNAVVLGWIDERSA